MLGRHGVFLELNEDVEEYEDLTEIMSNVQLNSNFLALAREVSVEKTPGLPLTVVCPVCQALWQDLGRDPLSL